VDGLGNRAGGHGRDRTGPRALLALGHLAGAGVDLVRRAGTLLPSVLLAALSAVRRRWLSQRMAGSAHLNGLHAD